jgi:tyrosine decarboxylase / aspartate 1-decarboxylase
MANMMTTMFGSVDNVEAYVNVLKPQNLSFKIHIDGAYGGFYYPFAHKDHALDFRNPEVSSITMDAHKMLQAPYGTGIFLCRKNLIQYANTKAGYVQGEDYTLIGSRSGANAIAIWMILMTYGPHAWFEKMLILKNRADWMEQQLKDKKITYFREPHSNILSMKAAFIDPKVAEKYGVIPDNHHQPTWYKVVIMDHVTIENLSLFLEEI